MNHSHDYISNDPAISHNSRRTLAVLILTTLMMIAEVVCGYVTGSMALLADGWHMASHAGAMALTLLAYRLARSDRLHQKLSFGAGKIIPLGGYTSAIVLAMIAVAMVVESVSRLFSPHKIAFNEAIYVAALGLIVNLASAWILGVSEGHETQDAHSHHGHDHHHGPQHAHKHVQTHTHHHHHVHDHNMRSAYFHVLADAFTSVLAIGALTAGKYFNMSWLDAAIGIVGAIVILRWAYLLCRETGSELLDMHSQLVQRHDVEQAVARTGATVIDLHLWRIAPTAVACELIVQSKSMRGSDYYRKLLTTNFALHHIIIEERLP